MAVSPTILVGLGELAMNAKVQAFAGRLAKDVYGRIMGAADEPLALEILSDPSEIDEIRTLSKKIENLPTGEELAASFGILQAELDRQHRKTRSLLYVSIGLSLVTVAVSVYAITQS